MSDTRSVATDALATLGTIIDDTAKRDAIHLAVAPAVAGQRLEAGWHVTVVDGVASTADDGDEDAPIGIVDPFLKRPVKKGEHFWVVLYPRTIQSLRHVWTHPAFADDPAIQSTSTTPNTDRSSESEAWLRDFIGGSDCPSYETIMALVSDDDSPDCIYIRGTSATGTIPLEFWHHAEIVLGRKLNSRATYFACSC